MHSNLLVGRAVPGADMAEPNEGPKGLGSEQAGTAQLFETSRNARRAVQLGCKNFYAENKECKLS